MIAAEDTRRLRRLCADLGVEPAGRVVSFFEANESGRAARSCSTRCAPAQDVLVVTDAGMPSVSDPGYRLVAAAVAGGLDGDRAARPVRGDWPRWPCPGCRWTGSASRGSCRARPGSGAGALAELAAEPRTLVFFEAPHRLAESPGRSGGRVRRPSGPAAVCRELTKTYEEVRAAGWASWPSGRPSEVRGEITVVVGRAPRPVSRPAAAELARPGRGDRGSGRADPQGGDRRGRRRETGRAEAGRSSTPSSPPKREPSPRRPQARGRRAH